MPDRRWRWLGAVLGVALLALVLWRLVEYRDQLVVDWATLSWPLIGAALAASCAAQFLLASAWHVLIPATAAAGWRIDVARWSVSLAGKYIPGKVFQAVLRLGSYRAQGGSTLVAPAMLREILLSMSAACAWVAVHLATTTMGPRALLWPIALAALVLAVAALPSASRPFGQLLRRLMPGQVIATAPAQSRILAAWGLQAAAYLLLGVSVWLLAIALAPGQAPGLLACLAGLCFGGVVGVAAIMVPAGIGVREAALAWYLAAWLPAGPAALLAIAARLCLTAAEFAALLVGLWIVRAGPPTLPEPT
ncbi:hypothetical protein BH11PSE14_BH11PSE14_10840 [soil metagenome]